MPTMQLKDFPASGLQNSVANLRSKFGNKQTTDTNQIFGVKNAPARTGVLQPKYNGTVNGATSQPSKLTWDDKKVAAGSTEANRLTSKIKVLNSPTVTASRPPESTSHKRTQLLSSQTPTRSVTKHNTKNSAPDVLSKDPNPSSQPTSEKVSNTKPELSASLHNQNQSKRSGRNSSVPPVSGIEHQTVRNITDSGSKQTSAKSQPSCFPKTSPNVEVTTKTVKDSNSATFSSSFAVGMANPELVDKYSKITDVEELNSLLKETRSFEDRRAIRAVLRSLRDSKAGSTTTRTPAAACYTENSSLDLSRYSTEEDLKVLLHQTSGYEEKKQIRAAIRELRKKSDYATESTTPKRKPGNSTSRSAEGSLELSSQEPSSPNIVVIAKQLANQVESPSESSTQCVPAVDCSQAITYDDEVLVSPIRKQTKILDRPEGQIKVETYSKHSRTTSQSDVFEKSTRVTKISKVGALDVSEQDTVTTKEKTSQKGSVTSEADIMQKVSIKEKDGFCITEEVINIEKSSHSKASGRDEVTTTQISVVQEKYPPQLIKELTNSHGIDGQPLTMTCEFNTANGANNKLEITWLKDGKVVKNDKDIAMSLDGGRATLKIKELLYPDDSGKYTCRAENKYGLVETSGLVKVDDQPASSTLKFAQELCHLTAADGDIDVTLKCCLTEKHEGVVVSWYKDGKLLKNTSELKQTFDGLNASLVISEVFPDDSGEYECCCVKDSQELSSYANLKVAAADIKAKKIKNIDVVTSKTKEQDSNNNSQVSNEVSTDNSKTDHENTPAAVEGEIKPESSSIIESCASTHPPTTSTENGSSAEPAVEAADSKPQTKVSESKDSKSSLSAAKPGLKAVPKPSGMSRPGVSAENMANSLLRRLSKPNTSGSLLVNQTWKSNTVGNVQHKQTTANKSWGNTGALSTLFGKAAPTGARGAMAAFKQMDTANNPSSASAPKPNGAAAVSFTSIPAAKQAAKMIKRRAMGIVEIKQEMLSFCKANTDEYENVKIDNFSTSWNNGLAFLALIHHFYPDSFSWDKVDERRRRENFQLAFDLAEQKADIAPLLDVEDMVRMKKPDWKCVFTYVQSFYRKLRDHENNKHSYAQQ